MIFLSFVLQNKVSTVPLPLVQLEKWTEWWGKEQQASSEAELVPESQETVIE